MWDKNRTVEELISAYEQFFGFDILLTNVGRWPASGATNAIELQAAWGPAVLVGFEGEQGVSAITVNDQLRLSHISYMPDHDLLTPTIEILRAALDRA